MDHLALTAVQLNLPQGGSAVYFMEEIMEKCQSLAGCQSLLAMHASLLTDLLVCHPVPAGSVIARDKFSRSAIVDLPRIRSF